MSRSHRGISLKSLPLVPATEQEIPKNVIMSVNKLGSGRVTSMTRSLRDPSGHEIQYYDPNSTLPVNEAKGKLGSGRKVRRAHVNKYAGSTTKLPPVPATDLSMPRLYYCPYCDTVVPDAADLRNHLKRCALSSRRESNYATCKLYLRWVESGFNVALLWACETWTYFAVGLGKVVGHQNQSQPHLDRKSCNLRICETLQSK